VQASEGDAKAFAQFNSLSHMDGEAGEGHEETIWVLLHVAGDDTFAKLLQSSKVRGGYAAVFSSESFLPISNPKPYIKLHFPKTYAILYGNAAQQTQADQKPIEEVKARAEAGDAESEVELGLRYTNSEGVAKDQVEAVKWYRKAAEQNYARGQYNLGVGYYKGEGVVKDQAEAVKWFRKAAEQNLARAQYNLGVCYYNGEGVAKDYVEAYKWLLLAARQGDEGDKKNMTELESKLRPQQIAEGQKRARDFKPR
jgi:TPR repeat protein